MTISSKKLMTHRRDFLKNFSAGVVAAAVAPTVGRSGISTEIPELPPPAAPDPGEPYWELVKAQFAVPDDHIMVNAANLCPSPFVVRESVQKYERSLEIDVSFQNRAKFSEIRAQTLTMMADYLGCAEKEIALVRNTSEANCTVINGLDFQPGDEVVIWNQNHPSNNAAWKQRAARQGFTVSEVSVPDKPTSSGDLLEAFVDACTSRTRLLAFSHISNVSGIAVPAREICAEARRRGILTLIDGAQAFGFLQLNLHIIGCDFYTGSSHKWLMGPRENGILFVREEHLDRLYAGVIAAGWTEGYETIDQKIAALGQRNDATVAAMPDILKFHQKIGREKVENRVRQLTQHLKQRIREDLPEAEFVTPWDTEMSGCIVIANFPGKDNRQIFEKLYTDYGIACAPSGGVRFSPNIYNTIEDVDKIASALRKVVRDS
jgi:isopenicillin-N epimerase